MLVSYRMNRAMRRRAERFVSGRGGTRSTRFFEHGVFLVELAPHFVDMRVEEELLQRVVLH